MIGAPSMPGAGGIKTRTRSSEFNTPTIDIGSPLLKSDIKQLLLMNTELKNIMWGYVDPVTLIY